MYRREEKKKRGGGVLVWQSCLHQTAAARKVRFCFARSVQRHLNPERWNLQTETKNRRLEGGRSCCCFPSGGFCEMWGELEAGRWVWWVSALIWGGEREQQLSAPRRARAAPPPVSSLDPPPPTTTTNSITSTRTVSWMSHWSLAGLRMLWRWIKSAAAEKTPRRSPGFYARFGHDLVFLSRSGVSPPFLWNCSIYRWKTSVEKVTVYYFSWIKMVFSLQRKAGWMLRCCVTKAQLKLLDIPERVLNIMLCTSEDTVRGRTVWFLRLYFFFVGGGGERAHRCRNLLFSAFWSAAAQSSRQDPAYTCQVKVQCISFLSW